MVRRHAHQLVCAIALGGCACNDVPSPRGTDAGSSSTPATTATTATSTVDGTTLSEPPETVESYPLEPLSVDDLSGGSNLDRFADGERTRSLVAADFDGDGLDDFFVGNPGDPSFVVRNTSTAGTPSFELVQTLSEGHLSWTAAAADFDNDGDVDLMVGGGGNECQEADQLWRNLRVETGTLSFEDVTVEMGLTRTAALDLAATTGVRWADFDRDGWLDLYVAHNDDPRCGRSRPGSGQNQLWRNMEGSGFLNITAAAGVASPWGTSTRHPAVLDYDNDGDLDIFDANLGGDNRLLHNLLEETGRLSFGVVDASLLGGANMGPSRAFASCAADLDNDGFEDLVVLNRNATECIVATDDDGDTDGFGQLHAVFRNTGAGSFENATEAAGLGVTAYGVGNGVMGCQVGDLNGDGALDVFVGNGGPDIAGPNDLFLGASDGIAFTDVSMAIREPVGDPRRTHGTVITDVDGDGVPEIVVGNGGPAVTPDVAEPNRILSFQWQHPAPYLQVRLQGDGVAVNRDAIGARVELVFEGSDGSSRSLHRTVQGGSCFSADNGRALHFGLGRGASGLPEDAPVTLRVLWPDGVRSEHAVDGAGKMVVAYPG